MALYRIYRLNTANRIIAGSDVDCESDDAAFEWARQTFGMNTSAEIWSGARYVGLLPYSLGSFDPTRAAGSGESYPPSPT